MTSKSLKFFYRIDKITHGDLAVEALSKIVSTIQVITNAVTANTFLSRGKCLECLPSPSPYSCPPPRDSFSNRTCGKCPISSAVRVLIQKLFLASDEGFKIALCVAVQTRYLHSIQIWRVIKCSDVKILEHLVLS